MTGFFLTILDHLPQWGHRLLPAFGQTLLLTLSGFGLAFVLATVMELLRLLGLPLINRPLALFIEIVRALPILAVLYIISFGLPGIEIVRATCRESVCQYV